MSVILLSWDTDQKQFSWIFTVLGILKAVEAATSLPTFFFKNTMREDRFTEFPEELARYMFSALPTPDFFALHRSSKKCRQLCQTTSFLKFDLLPYFVGRDRSEGCENDLANYLDQFSAHRGRRKTQYFRLRWYDSYRPCTWLCYAMQNEVVELDLDFTLDDAKPCINFPHSLYTCESLRCLTMNLNRNIFYWDFPSSIPFPDLQFLSLKLLRVGNGCPFGEWNPSWLWSRHLPL